MGKFGIIAAFVGTADSTAIILAAAGVVFWLCVVVGFRTMYPELQEG